MSFNATLTWPDPCIVSVISELITFVSLGGAAGGGRYVLVKVGSRSTNCSGVTGDIIGSSSSVRAGSTGKIISDGGFVVVGLFELVELEFVDDGFCGCNMIMVGVT